MRDRDQRLRWIEKLIGTAHQATDRQNALVIPTDGGNVGIAFPFIEEMVAADHISSLAFLPAEFCGVLHHGNELAPIIDAGGKNGEPVHVVLLRSRNNLLGVRFRGMPYVVDLDETKHAVLELRDAQQPARGVLPMLDVPAAIDALLARD